MGRLYILLVVAATAGSSLLFFRSSAPMAASAEQRTYAAINEAQAREVALTGLADAEATFLQQLARFEVLTLPTSWANGYGGGTYSIDAIRDDSMVVVTATGTLSGTEHRVRRAYRPEASEVPPFMTRAIHTGQHLQLGGPLTVTVPPPANADIHANGHISVRDVSTMVMGHASASMRLQNRTRLPTEALFLPNTPVGAGPSWADGVPEIPIPPVDAAPYRPLADVVLPRRSKLSGRVPLGTEDDPVVIYAETQLGTDGPVEFDGWGILIVETSFTVDHPIRTVGDETRSQLLVIVGQHATVKKDLDISGNWLVGHSLTLDGDARFTNGTITTHGHLKTKGSLHMEFHPVSTALAGVLWPDHMVPRSHREW